MVHFHWPTLIPIPIIVSIPIVMQKCSTGTDSYGDSYANHGHFTSLFEKLIVAAIDPLLACLVIPTTGLYNNSYSLNK